MTVAAKCNITGFVLDELSPMFYGLKCKDNSYAIVENYIESLGCTNINLQICNPADCENNPTVFECEFNIVRTTVVINGDGNLVTFNVSEEDYFGGTSPFTYEWTFETDDFIISGPVNTSQLVLAVKPGKVLANLVTKISVTITDANGCTDTKECWLNKGDLRCSVNFVACSNPSGLVTTNNFVQCAGPSGLIVTKV